MTRIVLLMLIAACSGSKDKGGGEVPTTSTFSTTVSGAPTQAPGLGLPEGLLAMFELDACPAGWSDWSSASGRALVAVSAGADVGVTVGDMLDTIAPTAHDHGIEATFDIPGAGVAAISGCCNNSPGASGLRQVGGITEPADSTLPTVALAVCRNDVGTDGELGSSLPDGVTAFFDLDSCPEGMVRPANSSGRFVVASSDPAFIGTTLGTELAPGEVPTHSHDATLAVTIPQESQAVAGGGNNDHAAKGTWLADTTTEAADAELPYAQALLCEVVQAEPSMGGPDLELTAGGIVYSTSDCPEGWEEHLPLNGRFAVGRPAGSFSGETHALALADGEVPTHVHGQNLSVEVPSQGIAAVAGCCFNGTGGNGVFDVVGDTEAASVALPWIYLRACFRP